MSVQSTHPDYDARRAAGQHVRNPDPTNDTAMTETNPLSPPDLEPTAPASGPAAPRFPQAQGESDRAFEAYRVFHRDWNSSELVHPVGAIGVMDSSLGLPMNRTADAPRPQRWGTPKDLRIGGTGVGRGKRCGPGPSARRHCPVHGHKAFRFYGKGALHEPGHSPPDSEGRAPRGPDLKRMGLVELAPPKFRVAVRVRKIVETFSELCLSNSNLLPSAFPRCARLGVVPNRAKKCHFVPKRAKTPPRIEKRTDLGPIWVGFFTAGPSTVNALAGGSPAQSSIFFSSWRLAGSRRHDQPSSIANADAIDFKVMVVSDDRRAAPRVFMVVGQG